MENEPGSQPSSSDDEGKKLSPEEQLRAEGVGIGPRGFHGRLMSEDEMFDSLSADAKKFLTREEKRSPDIGELYVQAQQVFSDIQKLIQEHQQRNDGLSETADISSRTIFDVLGQEMGRYNGLTEASSATPTDREQLVGYMRATVNNLEAIKDRLSGK